MLGGGVLAPGDLLSELSFPDHLEITGDSSLCCEKRGTPTCFGEMGHMGRLVVE